MPEGRHSRRRREDTWDDDPPSVPDQGLVASAADGTAQVELLREPAMPTGPTTRQRREDTWDTEAAAGSDTGPSMDGQDGHGQRIPVHPAGLPHSGGLLSWGEILSFGDLSPERVPFPRLQTASRQAASLDPEYPLFQPTRPTLPQVDTFSQPRQPASFGPQMVTPSVLRQDPSARSRPDALSQPERPAPFESESTLPSASEQAPPTLPQPGALSQLQRPRSGVDRGRRFRAYKATPIPRSLDEVRIPDRAELAAMEQVHGRPGPMSDTTLHQFCRGYRVPLDMALGMRARSMIGVYPSSLIYLDYERLARIPPQRHRSSGAEIPALYWARILTVKQAPYREHIEHFLSKSPGPCQCHNCQYEREHRMMTRRGRWS